MQRRRKATFGTGYLSPTNRLLRAFTGLTQLSPRTRTEFGDAVDYLYFTIYEGAGEDSLRFMSQHGGVFDGKDEAVRAVFRLKTLRNKMLRHDPDHGDAGKIRKSWQALEEALRGMGMSHLPTSSEDFRFLYRALLDGLAAFLGELLVRLQRS